MNTNTLRALIQTKLLALKDTFSIQEVSYRVASNDQIFPHIVYDFTSITPSDMGREDYLIDIHIWDRSDHQARAFNILDAISKALAFDNAPGEVILPTFYEQSVGQIDDPDKTLVHLVYRAQAQVYDQGVTNDGIINH